MKKTLTFLLLAIACFSAHAAVPFTFQAGQPAKAAEVNQNFTNLDQRVTAAGSISVDRFTFTNQSVASASCPASSAIVGIGCSCLDGNGTKNLGVLFGCDMAGNGGVAGCSPEAITFNPNKAFSDARVTVQCLSGGSGITSRSAPKSTEDLDAMADEMRSKIGEVESALRRRK